MLISQRVRTAAILAPKMFFRALRVLQVEIFKLVKLDTLSAVFVLLMLLMFLPTIGRYSSDAAMLSSFVDDEPLITMQLDGMTTWPWGDPSNYLDYGLSKKNVPSHWLNIRYTNIPYYGGLYLDIAALLWIPLKLAGLPLFPTAPIVLRLIALTFSILTLLAVYNLGKVYFGKSAGIIGACFVITEYWFLKIGTIIHPDSLLFFLCLLSLAACLRHAQRGSTANLIAIGIIAGLAQGAKMGGPLLVPIVALSIIYRIKRHIIPHHLAITLIVRHGLIVFSIAILVFVFTTPYSILGKYYFYTWQVWSKAFVGESPISPTTFWTWFQASTDHLGYLFISATLIGFVTELIWPANKLRLPALFMAVLATSICFWYFFFQKYWVQLQYLLVPFALFAIMAGSLVEKLIVTFLISRDETENYFRYCFIALIAVYSHARIATAVAIPVNYFLWKDANAIKVGDWLSKNATSPANGRVLYDLYAYFDPRAFPNQFPNGGPVRWIDLERVNPDYFTLSFYDEGHWMRDKIKTQSLTQWDTDYWNMRLYQDLLAEDGKDRTSNYQFIELVGSFRNDDRDICNSWSTDLSRKKLKCMILKSGITAGLKGPAIFLFKFNSELFQREILSKKLPQITVTK